MPPQPVPPIRKLPRASYPYPSEGTQNGNHNYRKLTKLIIDHKQPCLTQWNCESCLVGPPKMEGSWWRVLTKHGPLEKGTANYFSILPLRTSWIVWKVKKIWHWKMNSQLVGAQYATEEEWRKSSRKKWRGWAKMRTMSSCGCDLG